MNARKHFCNLYLFSIEERLAEGAAATATVHWPGGGGHGAVVRVSASVGGGPNRHHRMKYSLLSSQKQRQLVLLLEVLFRGLSSGGPEPGILRPLIHVRSAEAALFLLHL